MRARLSPDDLQKNLRALPDWTYDGDRGGMISRQYRFADFVQAFEFMRQMAEYSERVQHHPEWTNVYQRVSVTLTTHDVGGLTSLDIQWAIQADQVAGSISV